jgi:hypothetical protein
VEKLSSLTNVTWLVTPVSATSIVKITQSFLADLHLQSGILNLDGKKKKACQPAGFSASGRRAVVGPYFTRFSLVVRSLLARLWLAFSSPFARCSLITVHSSLRHRLPAPGSIFE